MNKINFKSFAKIFGLFIISRLLIAISFLIALHNFDSVSLEKNGLGTLANRLLTCLNSWDSGWYLKIAGEGYVYQAKLKSQPNFGFFPLYPMAIKYVAAIVHNYVVSGIIISNSFLLLGGLFLYALCIKVYKDNLTAMLAVMLLFFFPGSYLFSGVFSESAFVCLAIMCIYYFECENYLLCGISGFFLTLTRPFGILIILVLPLAYFIKYGIELKRKAVFLILIPMGMLCFFTYYYFTTGDFLFYVHTKQIVWKTDYSWPWKIMIAGLSFRDNIYIQLNAYYTLLWLVLPLLLARYLPFYLLVFVLLLILAPLSNGFVNLICMPRYIVVCFPLFMLVARAASKSLWGRILAFLLIAINMVLAGFFALGYQFAA